MTIWFILKVLHVFGAIVWMGGGTVMVLFIGPAVQATAPAGGAVMAHLVGKLKLPVLLNHSAWLTTICGALLLYHVGDIHGHSYFKTMQGAGLAVGSLFGLLAFVAAVFVQLPRSKRIAAMAAEAAGKPTPEQAAAMGAEQRKFILGGRIIVGLFALTLLGMLVSHPI